MASFYRSCTLNQAITLVCPMPIYWHYFQLLNLVITRTDSWKINLSILLKCAERWGPEYDPKEVKEIPVIDFCETLQKRRQALKTII